MDRDTLLEAAKVCDTWEQKLSYGGGYALKIVAHELRALAAQLTLQLR